MTREIKFRAWDGEHNQMVYDEAMSNLTISFTKSGELNIAHYFDNGDWYELTPLQYTGLKDNNGKEIYEGDILEGGTPYGSKKLEVKFINEGWYPFCVKMMRTDNCEVIGNIYENPELL